MPALYHRVDPETDQRLKAVPCYCQQVDLPLQQPYRVTSMIRSKERKTDELVPAPTKVNLGETQIRAPYPAEHKWASHIQRYATFPAFDTNQSDPRYAVELWHYPKSPSLPNKRDDYYVEEKHRCDSRRLELMKLPQGSSQHKHLDWPSDLHWQIYPRNPSPKTYPIPPKLIEPTMPVPTDREQELGVAVSARNANAARNYQNDLWQSVTHRQFSGLGEQHPNALDDFDTKMLNFPLTERPLEPRSTDTMVPSTTFSGRAAPTYKQVTVGEQLFRESTYVPNIPSMLQRSQQLRSSSPLSSRSASPESEQRNPLDENSQPIDDPTRPYDEVAAQSQIPLGELLAKDVLLFRRKQSQYSLPLKDTNSTTQVLYNQEGKLASDQASRGTPLIPFAYAGMPSTRLATDSFSRLQNSYPRTTTGHIMLDVYRHQKHESDCNYLNRSLTARDPPTCSEQQRAQTWREYLREAVLNAPNYTPVEARTERSPLTDRRAAETHREELHIAQLARTTLTERSAVAKQHRFDDAGNGYDRMRSDYLKIDAHAKFNAEFPEKTPNLYENNDKGRRHHVVVK